MDSILKISGKISGEFSRVNDSYSKIILRSDDNDDFEMTIENYYNGNKLDIKLDPEELYKALTIILNK